MTIDFIKLLEILSDNKVSFSLVGGLAAAAYGSPQITEDVDICIDLSPQNLHRLKKSLSDFNPVHRMHPSRPPFNEDGKKLESMKNIYLSTCLGQLDCIGEIKGIGRYVEAAKKSVTIKIRDKDILILSLDSLITSKEAMGRPKDKEAVLILKAIAEKKHKDKK
jgi:hypothetical protein